MNSSSDLELMIRVRDFLKPYNCKGTIRCDKDETFRVEDFCITFEDNDWFQTEWYNCSNHLSKMTRYNLDSIEAILKANSKALGITRVRRRGFGIIFSERKGVPHAK